MRYLKSNSTILISGVIVIVVFFGYFTYLDSKYKSVTSFDSCVSHGYTVLATYPEKCVLPGKFFVNPRQKETKIPIVTSSTTEVSIVNPYQNLTFYFEGQGITFAQGKAVVSIKRGSHVATTTLTLLPDIYTFDINNDSATDTLLFITLDNEQSSKSSLHYLVAAIKLANGYVGSNALYIGKDIRNESVVSESLGTVLHVAFLNNSVPFVKGVNYKDDYLQFNK